MLQRTAGVSQSGEGRTALGNGDGDASGVFIVVYGQQGPIWKTGLDKRLVTAVVGAPVVTLQ